MNQLEVINDLPQHLRPFVAVQDYRVYTPRDQAVWRFLLHQLKDNLSATAHPVYLEGLARTGISLEHIPSIDEMNQCLARLGWRAVAVNGFIPPIVFMELQGLRVLAIATEMRSMEHMLYTPAPDIVHESAGHAPFIVDEDYSEFLQRFGQLGMRAIARQADIDLYEAVRHLSIVKESASATGEDIAAAEQRLTTAMSDDGEPSEAALLARLQWWIIEYGLVGSPEDYRIFGAGLLSSLGESVNCLDDQRVKKIPLTVDAVATAYDITREQPQLFVARNCRHLSQVLEEFGRQMAVTRGGAFGLERALQAATVNTAVSNSGIAISGCFSRILKDAVGNVIYLNTRGPTQLSYGGQQLQGQGIDHHSGGFGSPLGRLQGLSRCLSEYSVDELKEHDIAVDRPVELNFVSGIRVAGTLRHILRRDQHNILFTLQPCRVIDAAGHILFDPDWGSYDMVVGEDVVSVYGGSADPVLYPLFAAPLEPVQRSVAVDAESQQLFECYAALRRLRESGREDSQGLQQLLVSARSLHEPEWLLMFELLELAQQFGLDNDDTRRLVRQLQQRVHCESGDEAILVGYALRRLGIAD